MASFDIRGCQHHASGYVQAMNRVLLIAVAAGLLVVSGCLGASDKHKQTTMTHGHHADDPEAWVMSPDAFGPITVNTTKAEALATGAYTEWPGHLPSCAEPGGLNWHSQTYTAKPTDWDGDGKLDAPEMTEPYLSQIDFRYPGTGIEYIDPNPDTVTDKGIKRGSSVAELKAAYGADLISSPFNSNPQSGEAYAVNGKQSFLLFSMSGSKVDAFFIESGTIKDAKDFPIGRDGGC